MMSTARCPIGRAVFVERHPPMTIPRLLLIVSVLSLLPPILPAHAQTDACR